MSIAKKKPLAKNAYRLTGSEALRSIHSGELTVEQLASSLLNHINKRDKYVKAWAYLDEEYVLDQARALDAVPMEKRGRLHGLPIAVKDVIYTKGK
ncbi:hypothetical protein NLG97_g8907 [Lecanicillium saksenae]|uniref:Uncharacterized protein n=1 Tax=Lecanicillium saksenae TaxID=468837 RepID=A0ACC1QKW5_9HYPO|nr:hypothetical protein NLG97_g8907 [Lecanicillium saksenae]